MHEKSNKLATVVHLKNLERKECLRNLQPMMTKKHAIKTGSQTP